MFRLGCGILEGLPQIPILIEAHTKNGIANSRLGFSPVPGKPRPNFKRLNADWDSLRLNQSSGLAGQFSGLFGTPKLLVVFRQNQIQGTVLRMRDQCLFKQSNGALWITALCQAFSDSEDCSGVGVLGDAGVIEKADDGNVVFQCEVGINESRAGCLVSMVEFKCSAEPTAGFVVLSQRQIASTPLRIE